MSLSDDRTEWPAERADLPGPAAWSAGESAAAGVLTDPGATAWADDLDERRLLDGVEGPRPELWGRIEERLRAEGVIR